MVQFVFLFRSSQTWRGWQSKIFILGLYYLCARFFKDLIRAYSDFNIGYQIPHIKLCLAWVLYKAWFIHRHICKDVRTLCAGVCLGVFFIVFVHQALSSQNGDEDPLVSATDFTPMRHWLKVWTIRDTILKTLRVSKWLSDWWDSTGFLIDVHVVFFTQLC